MYVYPEDVASNEEPDFGEYDSREWGGVRVNRTEFPDSEMHRFLGDLFYWPFNTAVLHVIAHLYSFFFSGTLYFMIFES